MGEKRPVSECVEFLPDSWKPDVEALKLDKKLGLQNLLWPNVKI